MKKIFALFASVVLVSAVNSQAASNGSWGEYTGQVLNIESVDIHLAFLRKGGNNTLGGPGAGPGTSNFAVDGYTAPTWAAVSPSVFSIEQYSFTAADTITHRTVVINNAGPFPTPVSLAYAWQDCNNGVIFPDLPDLLGTTMDGMTLALTLPIAGIYYISVDISGIATGYYDWGWMARYDGVTPIPVPPAPDTDISGFEFGGGSMALHNVADLLGDGRGSGRPWCFEVTP